MLRLKLSMQAVLLITVGIFSATGLIAAGYVRMFETLLETSLILFLLSRPSIILPGGIEGTKEFPSKILWRRILATKIKTLNNALTGNKPIRAIASLIMVGIVFGWLLTLGWLFIRDWQIVVSREIIETVLDIWIFVPGIIIATHYFRHDIEAASREKSYFYSRAGKADAWEEAQKVNRVLGNNHEQYRSTGPAIGHTSPGEPLLSKLGFGKPKNHAAEYYKGKLAREQIFITRWKYFTFAALLLFIIGLAFSLLWPIFPIDWVSNYVFPNFSLLLCD